MENQLPTKLIRFLKYYSKYPFLSGLKVKIQNKGRKKCVHASPNKHWREPPLLPPPGIIHTDLSRDGNSSCVLTGMYKKLDIEPDCALLFEFGS